MNATIDTWNHWGDSFLNVAWPMLWQSSLLIAVVFALDGLLARKLRASIRHALWLVVLVKLLLPPTLALPTGATWWLWPAKPALVPVMKNVTVTYSTDILPPAQSLSVPLPPLPPPAMSNSLWLMLASGVVSVALLLWLAFHWWRVTRKTRSALVSSAYDSDLAEARRLAGSRAQIRLRLIDETMSPAVYGLFRPVILLPRALAETLSRRQLRAVLLHEAIHLRRGDVWVNCAQTLLQIAYWWHPLLWLANARMRRLREEAVDDAVMAALRADADAYAPTLLEVAKFAFRRPLASLGLVGILESRSALRQRIERLVDFRPPRKAGLGLLPLCVIFAFSAVALPMGQAPAPENTATSPMVETNSPPPESSTPAVETNRMSRNPIAEISPEREALNHKLKEIHLDTVSFQNLPLNEVIRILHEQSQLKDPDKAGINFAFAPNTGATQINITLALKDVSLAATLDAICLVSDHPIKYSIEDYGVVFSSKNTNAVQYEMRTFKVNPKVLAAALGITNKMPVSTQTVPDQITPGTGLLYINSEYDDFTSAIKQFLQKQGVNLDPPKALFYNDRLGLLFVYATPKDLDVVERGVQMLMSAPPQIHIQARFIEMPADTRAGVPSGMGILTESEMKTALQLLLSQKGVEEVSAPEATLLSGRQVQMRAVETDPVVTNYTITMPPRVKVPAIAPQVGTFEFGSLLDAVPLALADGYTISLTTTGSRIQFFGYADTKGLKPVTTNYDGGTITLPMALPAIQMSSATASALLYDNQTLVLFPKWQPQPLFSPTDEKSRKRVLDHIAQAKKKNPGKQLVIFVTVTLIDPAGNRIHSDDEMPFAQNNVPKQPQVLPDTPGGGIFPGMPPGAAPHIVPLSHNVP